MYRFGKTIRDLDAGRDLLRARSHGIIETVAGELRSVQLRPWPKLASLPELWPLGPRYHARGDADRCLLYFNQPRRCLTFWHCDTWFQRGGRAIARFERRSSALDSIAEIKQIDAIVCDAGNVRLSERLMARLGWEPHQPSALASQLHSPVLRRVPWPRSGIDRSASYADLHRFERIGCAGKSVAGLSGLLPVGSLRRSSSHPFATGIRVGARSFPSPDRWCNCHGDCRCLLSAVTKGRHRRTRSNPHQ